MTALLGGRSSERDVGVCFEGALFELGLNWAQPRHAGGFLIYTIPPVVIVLSWKKHMFRLMPWLQLQGHPSTAYSKYPPF